MKQVRTWSILVLSVSGYMLTKMLKAFFSPDLSILLNVWIWKVCAQSILSEWYLCHQAGPPPVLSVTREHDTWASMLFESPLSQENHINFVSSSIHAMVSWESGLLMSANAVHEGVPEFFPEVDFSKNSVSSLGGNIGEDFENIASFLGKNRSCMWSAISSTVWERFFHRKETFDKKREQVRLQSTFLSALLNVTCKCVPTFQYPRSFTWIDVWFLLSRYLYLFHNLSKYWRYGIFLFPFFQYFAVKQFGMCYSRFFKISVAVFPFG